MTRLASAVPAASADAAERTRRGHPSLAWVRRLARYAYFAKGIIHALIGVIAARVAFGLQRAAQDSRGVLWTILNQPLGEFLLIFMGVTLAFFGAWRIIQAVGPRRWTGSRLGAAQRIFRLYSAGVHLVMAASALRVFVLRDPGASSEQSFREMAGAALAQPYGRAIVALASVILGSVGVYKIVRASRKTIWRDLRFRDLPPWRQRVIVALGRIGEATRGVVFGVMGAFMLQAAVRYDAAQVHGLAGTLQALGTQAYGPWLLLAAAAGFLAFGAFLVLSGRYQRL